MKRGKARNGTVLDLFAGCGGFSLGFNAAGFDIVDGIEIDETAHATHRINFGGPSGAEEARDIRLVDPDDYLTSSGSSSKGPDIIIGGPPCQPFTRIGRAKLREVAGKHNAHLLDDRASFYVHFLAFVESLKPLAFVMENVRDIANFGGRNVPEEIAVTAEEELGYEVRYAILNAAWYGVPQMRERLFIVGIRSDLNQIPLFPTRTHRIQLPRGYVTSRVGRMERVPVPPPHDHYTEDVEELLNLSPAVTVEQAISDLPPLLHHLESTKARVGARTFDKHIEYADEPDNLYQRLMRNWPGMDGRPTPADHVIRFTPRDYPLFRELKPGDQYPQAYQAALQRFDDALDRMERQSGRRLNKGTKAYEELFASIVPPYDPHKFPNKWRKMEPDAPARTIPAHIGKDTYSHIHYDSKQARTISVREAARLQSFPDGFRFSGAMNEAFRQIGNSVPPLLAYALAASLRRQLQAAGIYRNERTRVVSQELELFTGMPS